MTVSVPYYNVDMRFTVQQQQQQQQQGLFVP